jgi:hypothetical protein
MLKVVNLLVVPHVLTLILVAQYQRRRALLARHHFAKTVYRRLNIQRIPLLLMHVSFNLLALLTSQAILPRRLSEIRIQARFMEDMSALTYLILRPTLGATYYHLRASEVILAEKCHDSMADCAGFGLPSLYYLLVQQVAVWCW